MKKRKTTVKRNHYVRTVILLIILSGVFCFQSLSADVPLRVIHVFVALCDNVNQGIVPVPEVLGNGEDPDNNLYWGALYGVRTHFKKSEDWKLVETFKDPSREIVERCVFRHRRANVYLVADAYRGSQIRRAVVDFLEAASGNSKGSIEVGAGSNKVLLPLGGSAGLLAYVGHDGLMDFRLESYPEKKDDLRRDAIVLACISKKYFKEAIASSGANPLLWTTGLMAPEAYTLKAAIDGWIEHESAEQIRTRAARAYNHYQKCGLKAAKRLLVSGF